MLHTPVALNTFYFLAVNHLYEHASHIFVSINAVITYIRTPVACNFIYRRLQPRPQTTAWVDQQGDHGSIRKLCWVLMTSTEAHILL